MTPQSAVLPTCTFGQVPWPKAAYDLLTPSLKVLTMQDLLFSSKISNVLKYR
jgi:hypothetical protein